MRAQKVLGHKNLNPKLSDQFRATKVVTYAHQKFEIYFIALQKVKTQRALAKRSRSWDGKVEIESPRLFADNSRLQDSKTHSLHGAVPGNFSPNSKGPDKVLGTDCAQHNIKTGH